MMAKYFTLNELTRSDTANRLGIKNNPDLYTVERLNYLMQILDQIRKEWGSAIRVTSGYRCKALNKAVGGVTNSNHIYGTAADLQPVNGKLKDFFPFVKKCCEDMGLEWDEILYEKSGKSEWLHFAFMRGTNGQRRKKYIQMTVK